MTRNLNESLGEDATELLVGELTAALHTERRDAPAPTGVTATSDAMPQALAERVIAAGERLVRAERDAAAPSNAVRVVPTIASGAVRSARAEARRVWSWSGWMAAAAVLTLWAIGARRPGADAPPVAAGAQVASSAQRAATQLRDSLLSNDTSAVQLAMTATADSTAQGATGDVVWSVDRQTGVLRLAGLRANDRRRWQYQLWIFDKRRDQRYPVDGGVFDIPANAREVMIPIHARVPVGEATLFAITVEQAGGVVVSARDRIAMLAKAGG